MSLCSKESCTFFALSQYAFQLRAVIAAEKAHFAPWSVADITVLVFHPALMMVKRVSHHGKFMAHSSGVVVPKDVDAAAAIVQTQRTIEFHAAGDLAICFRAVCVMHTVFKKEGYLFSVPLSVHHVRDVQRQRHARGDPRRTPEVRPMTFKRELGEVLIVSLHCSVLPVVSAVIVSSVCGQDFRITRNVIFN